MRNRGRRSNQGMVDLGGVIRQLAGAVPEATQPFRRILQVIPLSGAGWNAVYASPEQGQPFPTAVACWALVEAKSPRGAVFREVIPLIAAGKNLELADMDENYLGVLEPEGDISQFKPQVSTYLSTKAQFATTPTGGRIRHPVEVHGAMLGQPGNKGQGFTSPHA